MASWSRSQCGASDRDAIFLNDALGSTTGVQDATQSRVDWMWYQAYGYTYVNRASVGTAYLFGGKHGYYADGDSGMLLLGRRYYLPSFHRFLTQDPSGHAAGLNLYEYASNNPLTNVDPTGLDGDNVHVNIIYQGYNSAQKDFVRHLIWDEIDNTPTGRQLLHWDTTVMIRMPRRGESHYPQTVIGPRDARGRRMEVVVFDPDYNHWPVIAGPNNEPFMASKRRMLAHELGHAIARTKDAGPGEMLNVNTWENPIARELGEQARIYYEGWHSNWKPPAGHP